MLVIGDGAEPVEHVDRVEGGRFVEAGGRAAPVLGRLTLIRRLPRLWRSGASGTADRCSSPEQIGMTTCR